MLGQEDSELFINFKLNLDLIVERFLIIITILLIFSLYTALKLLTVAMAMLANFALSKEKIQSKINAIPIKKRSTSLSQIKL